MTSTVTSPLGHGVGEDVGVAVVGEGVGLAVPLHDSTAQNGPSCEVGVSV